MLIGPAVSWLLRLKRRHLAATTTLAITCAVFVITDFLFHRGWAAAFTAVVALAFLVLWYALPLRAAYVDRPR